MTSRRLYDEGTWVRMAPSLASLADDKSVHVHPSDLERLGAQFLSLLLTSSPGQIEIFGSHSLGVVVCEQPSVLVVSVTGTPPEVVEEIIRGLGLAKE